MSLFDCILSYSYTTSFVSKQSTLFNYLSQIRNSSCQTQLLTLLHIHSTTEIGTAERGTSFFNVIPYCSLISSVSGPTPSGSSHSKECNNTANIKTIILLARGIPGQIRLPAPNGKYSKSLPLKSTLESTNLSGLKTNGSSQNSGFLPIDQTLIKTWFPL
ncbi:hypothetical protein KIW84_065103 [Lathyrus oleraceus]|uniref:Uncharacterized protein n=1 Tax=Pisum sativum TaxID=3888 RepID=A0A9D5A9N0_PEA|nr:hypothetical protein KIW84_065103 [Pisum sativum]